jgi:radical SAM superfamily enzyme YgiQ (UPF0313 family)/protein-L-isoaspartate O-methyltransferase
MTSREPALLLISPGIIKWTDMDFGVPHLVSIGGYVRQETGARIEILDLNYEGGDHRHLERTLEELGPYHAIGLSCYSSFDYMRVMSLARFLKKLYPDVPLVTGGYHASALPEDVLFDGSPFDAVIPGEGELPMAAIVKQRMAGEPVERKIWEKGVIADLDTLPPYQWDLLDRYWPRARDIGRKFQIYLARGCPYRCTFCMERAKSGYKWRAYSAERAVDELKRLSTYTDLSDWIVNVADPLFGFNRAWRRDVLQGIIEHDLLPRQYWTLTRSDDLHDEDVELLARANFSIGIGMESGSPRMLKLMQKARKPEKYLEAQLRLARLSLKHGLNWAGNIIVGHPGETIESMRETVEFARELLNVASDTCGWISLDPFRLYPGSHVHEAIDHYRDEYGTRFYHPEWWKSWYDAPFRAEHLDASDEVDFETRVNFMYDHFAPVVRSVVDRFRGQGRSVDRVFQRSLSQQADLLSDRMRNHLLRQAKVTRRRLDSEPDEAPALEFPIGLHVRDERVRRREETVRRLLERGVLRTDRLIEALLTVAPEPFLGEEGTVAMFRAATDRPADEGAIPRHLGIDVIAIGLEALNPTLGDRAADLVATNGYLTAVISEMVGDEGFVVAVSPTGIWKSRGLKKSLAGVPGAKVLRGTPTTLDALQGQFDAVWFGGTLPKPPRGLVDVLHEHGRFVSAVGPRFGRQDLVCVTAHDEALSERVVAHVRLPVIAGPQGWIPETRHVG